MKTDQPLADATQLTTAMHCFGRNRATDAATRAEWRTDSSRRPVTSPRLPQRASVDPYVALPAHCKNSGSTNQRWLREIACTVAFSTSLVCHATILTIDFSGFSLGALSDGHRAGSFTIADAVDVGHYQVNSANYEFVFFGTQGSYLSGSPAFVNTVVNDFSHAVVRISESQYGSTYLVEDVKTSTENFVQHDEFPGGGASSYFSGTNIAASGQLGLARRFTLVNGPIDLGSTSTQTTTSVTNYTCRQWSGGSLNSGICLDYDPYTFTTFHSDIVRHFVSTKTIVSDYSLGFSIAGEVVDDSILANLRSGLPFDFDLGSYGNIGLASARLFMDVSPIDDPSPAAASVAEPGSLLLVGLGLWNQRLATFSHHFTWLSDANPVYGAQFARAQSDDCKPLITTDANLHKAYAQPYLLSCISSGGPGPTD
jgi:hypothetical protein